MTSIICLFKLVHLYGLLFVEWVDHVVKELNVEEALQSSIFSQEILGHECILTGSHEENNALVIEVDQVEETNNGGH